MAKPQAIELKETLYNVTMIAVKEITNKHIKQAMDLTKCKIKVYLVEYGDLTPLVTSNMDKNVVEAIEVLKSKGIKVFTFGGSPTPPPCPPRGCNK